MKKIKAEKLSMEAALFDKEMKYYDEFDKMAEMKNEEERSYRELISAASKEIKEKKYIVDYKAYGTLKIYSDR